MTMTGARQILSFTLGSLFAHWGSLSHANDKTAYERELDRLLNACDDELPAVRRRSGYSGKVLGGFDQIPWPHERRGLMVRVIDSVTAIRKAPAPGDGCPFLAQTRRLPRRSDSVR